MNFSNAAYDLANEIADRERESGILAAARALSGDGFTHCIGCGEPIDARRRAAFPGAKRCYECQSAYELEQATR